MQKLDDSKLCAQIKAGSSDAFEVLVRRHTSQFFRLAVQTLQSASDAEEAVQSAFIKFWQKPSSYDPSKSKFTTWFYRVVLNQCRDTIKRRRSSSDNIAAYIESSVVNDEQLQQGEDFELQRKQADQEQQVALEYAISKLTQKQREALNLVIYSELPQQQAAEILGISLKALESTLMRAKKQLHKDVSAYMASSQPASIDKMSANGLSSKTSFKPIFSSFSTKVTK